MLHYETLVQDSVLYARVLWLGMLSPGGLAHLELIPTLVRMVGFFRFYPSDKLPGYRNCDPAVCVFVNI